MYPNLEMERIRHGYTKEYVAKKLGITQEEYQQRSESGSFWGADALVLTTMYKKSFEYLFFQNEGKI